MADTRDYYEVLGVDRNASAEQIRRAYRKLARQYHPDVNKAADAATRFAEVQAAYDVLSEPEKRKNYDQFGHAGVGAGTASPGAGWGGFGRGNAGSRGPGDRTVWTSAEGMDDVDLGSIFEQMFGGAAAGRGGARQSPFGRAARPQPVRGQDVEHTITVSFMTAALGGTEQLRFSADSAATTISVKIPPGIESGAKLRVRGKGRPGSNGAPSGDLILTVEVGNHPYFKRERLDLLIDVPVNISEAVLGTRVIVPLLTGTVEIRVPEGVSSGKKLRVKGKGVTDSKGNSGDFYAVLQVVAPGPDELSESSLNSIRHLARELQNPRESSPWFDDMKSRTT